MDRADDAVPPGRLRLRDGEDSRLVRTFLSPTAWQLLRRSGRLTARQTEHEDLRRPYAWMSEQMSSRLGTPSGTRPLWVWVRTTRRALVSEAGDYLRSTPGTVLATCRIPDRRLLLSDFFDWSCVLLRTPVWPDGDDFDEADFERWCRDLERACPDHDELWPDRWPEPFRSRILASCQRVFETARRPPSPVLQACLAELLADDVVHAVQLGRPR